MGARVTDVVGNLSPGNTQMVLADFTSTQTELLVAETTRENCKATELCADYGKDFRSKSLRVRRPSTIFLKWNP
jgi:hypothetical protein